MNPNLQRLFAKQLLRLLRVQWKLACVFSGLLTMTGADEADATVMNRIVLK
jgi:hypothetical protein